LITILRYHDCCCVLTQTCNFKFGTEAHIGSGVMSTFVFLCAAITRAFASTSVGSATLRRGPRRFWLYCHECHHALMLRCQNSPWWQNCECCNNFCLRAAIARSTWTARSSPVRLE